MMTSHFTKGHTFNGPNGMGYRLLRDVYLTDQIMPDQFEAFGGAPEPKLWDKMPPWLFLACGGRNANF